MKSLMVTEKNQNPNVIDKNKYIINDALKKKLASYIWSLYVTLKGGVKYIHDAKANALAQGNPISESQVTGYKTCYDKAVAIQSGVSFLNWRLFVFPPLNVVM